MAPEPPPGAAVTWTTMSAIAGIIIGLVGLTKLALNPLEERIEAVRARVEQLEARAIVRLDRIEERLGRLEHEP